MNESILDSIKKLLGILPSVEAFDTDIIFHINSTFVILKQIGFGDKTFRITDNSETWDDFLDGEEELDLVKSYIYMKVRKMFDPPAGAVAESMNNMISELEWRISVAVDPRKEE